MWCLKKSWIGGRLVKKGNASLLQVFINRSGLPAANATWEDYDTVHQTLSMGTGMGHTGSTGGANVSGSTLKTAAELTEVRLWKKKRVDKGRSLKIIRAEKCNCVDMKLGS